MYFVSIVQNRQRTGHYKTDKAFRSYDDMPAAVIFGLFKLERRSNKIFFFNMINVSRKRGV